MSHSASCRPWWRVHRLYVPSSLNRIETAMQQSTDRILTTHVGSLPRSAAVTEVIFARERDDAAGSLGADVIAAAVADVVRRQVDAGVDIVSDGEMSKISYATYIAKRFSGFA